MDSDSESVYSNNTETVDDVPEDERQQIREKISTMSFEDLLKLKEEMGAKVYNETVYGTSSTRTKRPKSDFKRANKNRPREMSSKVRLKNVPRENVVVVKKAVAARDPRFDPLCGTFSDKLFKTNYKFLHEVRVKERKQLETQYEESKDVAEKKNIKYLMQRMDNQIREQEKRNKEKERILEERQEIRENLKQGNKAVFKKKSVRKLEGLIEKYEELKKTNKLQKHIEKKSKKASGKHKKQNSKIL